MSKYKFHRGPSLLGMLAALFIAFGMVWYITGSGDTPIMPGFKLDREKEERRIRTIKFCREVVRDAENLPKEKVASCEKFLKEQ